MQELVVGRACPDSCPGAGRVRDVLVHQRDPEERDVRPQPERVTVRVDEPDPRDVLAESADLSAGDLAALDARLARLDKAADDGPWTARVLQTIAEHPEVVSTELAQGVGLERFVFQRRVRSLKELGLTLSRTVGYRLSPRGAAYLSWRNSAEGTASARA